MTRTALGALKAPSNAAIVNTASIAGKKGTANLAAYCTLQFFSSGFNAITGPESLRRELKAACSCIMVHIGDENIHTLS